MPTFIVTLITRPIIIWLINYTYSRKKSRTLIILYSINYIFEIDEWLMLNGSPLVIYLKLMEFCMFIDIQCLLNLTSRQEL